MLLYNFAIIVLTSEIILCSVTSNLHQLAHAQNCEDSDVGSASYEREKY